MLDEFIEYAQSLFPSISPYVKEQTKSAIKQFNSSGKRTNFFNKNPYEFLAQGDILSNVPFVRINSDGQIGIKRSYGMVISNTCSADHDNDILMAPMLDINLLNLKKTEIVNNLNYRLMYFPDEKYQDLVVDFSLINTINKDILNKMIEEKSVKKESSLNQFGFYLFLTKLTICFMRPEDEEVQQNRRKEYFDYYDV